MCYMKFVGNLTGRDKVGRGVGRALGLCALLAALAVVQPVGASDPWEKLRRPLHLPRLSPDAACPVSRIDRRVDWERANIFGGSGIGRGPVYPGLGAYPRRQLTASPDQFRGPWGRGKVFWYVLPSYRGPVLVRGRRLDGPQYLRFNGHIVPDRELQIKPNETVFWRGQPRGSRGQPAGVRARASGCYAVQIDGTTFSRVVDLHRLGSVTQSSGLLVGADARLTASTRSVMTPKRTSFCGSSLYCVEPHMTFDPRNGPFDGLHPPPPRPREPSCRTTQVRPFPSLPTYTE